MSDDEQQDNTKNKQEKSSDADAKERTDDDDETLTQVSELHEDKSNNISKPCPQGDNEKRKKFFQEELKRLQKSLKAESENIHAPPVQEHVPYCFNALTPYYDTRTAEHVILKTGDDGKLKNVAPHYATRNTAIGLVDPWVSNRMDCQAGSPIKVKKPQPFRESPKKEKKVGEGSTMIPVFPHVDMDTPDLASRKLNYSDVPMLRPVVGLAKIRSNSPMPSLAIARSPPAASHLADPFDHLMPRLHSSNIVGEQLPALGKELKEKYSSQGKAKIDSDYQRTKVDFYRMELHRLGDVHPLNRDNMKAAYFAYLQNTPGSKKAVKECVDEILPDEKKDGEKTSDTDEESANSQHGNEEQEAPQESQEEQVAEA